MSLHHVTAIAGDPARNVAFYTDVLGLRLVKKTVNFDDPGTYHFYYGDEAGGPGSILTFFPWAGAGAGRNGVGQTSQTAFRVPAGSIGWWTQRFIERGVAHQAPEKRFGETVLPFVDPDGMSLALVGVRGADAEPAWAADVPAEHAIRGFHGVTLLLEKAEGTATVLTEVFGFAAQGREGSIQRFVAPGDAVGAVVDLHVVGGFLPPRPGRGSVHHIAFRAKDDAEQVAMVERLTALRIPATEQKDRNYFRSVYFREPGGVLFEIATDAPGFAIDEPADRLGEALKLPAFLEPHRSQIEAALPAIGRAA